MHQLQLHPYLFFGGNCREAMAFYQSVFGGDYSYKRLAMVRNSGGNSDIARQNIVL